MTGFLLLFFLFFSLFQSSLKLFSHVENAIGLHVAHETSRRFFVLCKGASFAEIVLAFGDNRIHETVAAYETLEW